MAIQLKHQTIDQFASRFRERYRESFGEQTAKLAVWLLDSFDRQDFQETPFKNAFGYTTAQWNSMRARLTTTRANYRYIKAINGE